MCQTESQAPKFLSISDVIFPTGNAGYNDPSEDFPYLETVK